MPPRPAQSTDETRARILAVAEELFRRVGYAKTAVADIASELGMSPANVYRFFASKSAINEAIARRMLDEMHAIIVAIADKKRPAGERLGDMALAIHRYNVANFVEERRIHDMVEAAMTENWGCIQEHLEFVIGQFARVIRDGVIAGEFAVQDIPEAARTFKQFHAIVFHPSLIAHCYAMSGADTQEDDVRRLTRYALRALKA
jgi:AcrR family transcriptional regulator